MLPVRKEIVTILRRLPVEKLYMLRDYAARLDDDKVVLTLEEISAIEEGKAQLARGEKVSLDEFCRKHNL